MPEVQASVKQIDLTTESADPGDAFKSVFTTTQNNHQCVYSESKISTKSIRTEQSKMTTSVDDSHLPPLTVSIEAKIKKPPIVIDTQITCQPVTNYNDSNDNNNNNKSRNNLSNGQLVSEVTAEKEDVTIPTASRKKLNRILTSLNKPFLYIAQGDFSIVWSNVIIFTVASILYIVAGYQVVTINDITIQKTWMFSYVVGSLSGLGITAGAHRLWSHRSYKAKLPLRIFLMICQCIAGQNCLYIWCRDHRVHHKFSETDADPHNSNRGFFFAHVGWLMRKKHPSLIIASEKMKFNDLLDDPVVRIQKDYYVILYLFFAVYLPVACPVFLWNEKWSRAILIGYFFRYLSSLHCTWFVNSTAHMFGIRPYNKNIQPRENPFVSYAAFGEGYHNYHHTFPFDYRTSEDGVSFNLSRHFIDLCAKFGLAYDLKKVSDETIKSSKAKASLHCHSHRQVNHLDGKVICEEKHLILPDVSFTNNCIINKDK